MRKLYCLQTRFRKNGANSSAAKFKNCNNYCKIFGTKNWHYQLYFLVVEDRSLMDVFWWIRSQALKAWIPRYKLFFPLSSIINRFFIFFFLFRFPICGPRFHSLLVRINCFSKLINFLLMLKVTSFWFPCLVGMHVRTPWCWELVL